MPLPPRLFNLLALGLLVAGFGSPLKALALIAHPVDGMYFCPASPGISGDSGAQVWQIKKFVPPTGPREDCLGKCRNDQTHCKHYAHDTSANDIGLLQGLLNDCDVASRKCRTACEPLKNNPQ